MMRSSQPKPTERACGRLGRFPIKLNRKALYFFWNDRIFYGKPASTFPENALAAMLWACCLGLSVLASAACLGTHAAVAQAIGAEPEVQVPGFWDPRRRPERPDISRMSVIRFMTEVDYPPFNFAGPDGNPTGFNVDLARMICEELKAHLHHADAPLRYA